MSNLIIDLIGKLILPNIGGKLFFMSISRYSGIIYQSTRYPIFMDLIYLFLLPFIGLYMLSKSVPVPVKTCSSKILCDAISVKYKDSVMSNIVSALKHEDIRYAGKDLDCDGVSDNQFLRMDALRIVFTGWIIFPPVFIFTLLGNVSLARALIKSLVVYYRSYRFFQYNPASIFLTIRDNTCSSALYSSFHNSNGKYFCAIQNGLRFKTEIGYSYLDHLFAINKDSIRLYQSTGSVINNFNIVPPLSLDKYLKTMSATVVDIDILFIDQGFPVEGI